MVGHVQGWCRGNVTIIGDAAHAGLPNGQGLNLAIEDGEHPMAALGPLHEPLQCSSESALFRMTSLQSFADFSVSSWGLQRPLTMA